MDWEKAFEVFTTGLAGIAIWFLYELVKEYRDFKEETSDVLQEISHQRQSFDLGVRAALLKIDELRNATETSIKVINHELHIFKKAMIDLQGQAERTKEFMEKNYILAKVLHDKHDQLEKEFKTIKIRMGEVTIFKTPK